MRLVLATLFAVLAARVAMQNANDLQRLLETPAVSGYAQALSAEPAAQFHDLSPKTDNLGGHSD